MTYGNGAKGTVSGGSFADLYLYGSGTAWLAGGSFTKLSTASFGVLSSLLADGAVNDPTQFEQTLVVVQNGWGHFMPELLALQGVQAFLYFMSCVT